MLTADCSRCFGLCCVLLPFSAASGFGVDKPGGTPCANLDGDDRCRIHATLVEDGWPGCTGFDCFGAGQQVSQVTYGGVSWREQDNLGEMAAVLSVVRRVHEMLAHLGEVGRRSPDHAAEELRGRLLELRNGTPVELLTEDIDELHEQAGDLLAAASVRIRGAAAPDLAGADLAGQDLRHRDLTDAALRGALLIGADLRGLDLGRRPARRGPPGRRRAGHQPLRRAVPHPAAAGGGPGDLATAVADRLRRPGTWHGAA